MKSKTQKRFDDLVVSLKRMRQPSGELYFTIDDQDVRQGRLYIGIGYWDRLKGYEIWVQKESRQIRWWGTIVEPGDFLDHFKPRNHKVAIKIFELVGKFNRMLEASA